MRMIEVLSSATLFVGLLAGCTQPPLAPPTAIESSPSVPGPSTALREPLSPADQIKVVAEAEGFMRALVRPANNRDAWWKGVQPYLTPAATMKLSSLQPSSVGFTRVNGSGQLMPLSEGDQADDGRTVAVLTDAGLFIVEIANPPADSRISSYHPQGGSLATPDSPATISDAALAKFATTFMHAFAKPAAGVSTGQWQERIASMLTDDAVDTYADITPAAVPVRRVTGPVKVEKPDTLGDDADTIRSVTVGTDAGVYKLLVQLPSSGFSDRMLVVEIQEP